MTTRTAFALLVAAVAVARLAELAIARRNDAGLRAGGAVERGAGHYPAMVAVHAGWLLAAPTEVHLLARPFHAGVGTASLVLFAAAFALRIWVIRTLGPRWTTRVLWVPGAPRIVGGPYRFLRHPNYVAVAIELAALPLVHGAWITSVAATVANGLLMRVRIASEERAIAELSGGA